MKGILRDLKLLVKGIEKKDEIAETLGVERLLLVIQKQDQKLQLMGEEIEKLKKKMVILSQI